MWGSDVVRRILSIGALLVAMLPVTEARLSAYIDPGPSFMLWQSLLAGFIGVAVFFQQALRRVLKFWTRRHDDGESSSPDR